MDEFNILEGVVLLDDVRENIDTVMDAFSQTDAWNLPVLDNGFYVGFLSKSRIYATYRELLVQFSEE